MDVSRSWEELRRPFWESLGDKSNKFTSSSKQPGSSQKSIFKSLPKVTVPALKTNVKTLRQPGAVSSRTSRFAQLEASRKDKRLDTHLANRGISKAVMDSSTTPASTGKAVTGSEMTTTTDARKKMLNKWKQEKTALQSKPANKPIFKPGGAVAIPPPVVPVIRQKPVAAKITPPVVERRVTRQMTKVAPPATTTNSNNKQISAQMKTLTINNNNAGRININRNGVGGLTSNTSGKKPSQQTDNKEQIKNNRNGFPSTGKDKPGVGKMNKINKKPDEKMDIEITPVVPAPVVILPKKLKPQAIDSVYIQYMDTFLQAIKQLEAFSKYWRPLVSNTPDIPESVQDEILSSIGKVQLLLGSKLPQFAELLHSYLCKEVSPFPILECDLQGWWDVAVIQVQQVCSDFEKLKELEANQWVQKEEVNVSIPLKKQSASVPGGSGSGSNKVKATATASKGMKEFLAMKRKAAQDQGSTSVTSAETSTSSSTRTPPEPEKNFEGGFFHVRSPARTGNSSNRASLRLQSIGQSVLPRTPGAGRRLSSNLSLLSLSLRNSMGPMYKLGAKGDANSELFSNSSE